MRLITKADFASEGFDTPELMVEENIPQAESDFIGTCLHEFEDDGEE